MGHVLQKPLLSARNGSGSANKCPTNSTDKRNQRPKSIWNEPVSTNASPAATADECNELSEDAGDNEPQAQQASIQQQARLVALMGHNSGINMPGISMFGMNFQG